MRPIETSGLSGVAPRVTGPVAATAGARPVERRESEVSLSAMPAGETAPVDTQRVNDIRKAIEDGRYPVIPARIADAMIAAGMLLRTKS